MFDTATCTEAVQRWAAWQHDAESDAGGYGDLTWAPGQDLAAEVTRFEPIDVGDEDLIERIGSWEKLTAWAQAGQLAEIAELAARRRVALRVAAAWLRIDQGELFVAGPARVETTSAHESSPPGWCGIR